MERRFQFGAVTGRQVSEPGLMMDDRGHVMLVQPGGDRFDLTALVESGALRSLTAGEASDPNAISLQLPPTAEDVEQTFLVGAIPYNVQVTGVAYVPATTIVFPPRSGDEVSSRGWVVKRQRPSEAYDVSVKAAILGAFDTDVTGAPAAGDGVTFQVGDLVLVAGNLGQHATTINRRNGVFKFLGVGQLLERYTVTDGQTVYVREGATLGNTYQLAIVEVDPSSPGIAQQYAYQFDESGPAPYSSQVIATALYDGESSGPVGEGDDYSSGIGTAEVHSGQMTAGVPYAFDLDQQVALSLRAGDIISVSSAKLVDTVRVAPPDSDVTFTSPADPGGLLIFEYLVVQEQSVTALPVAFADRAPQILDEVAAAADDPASDYLNANRADLNVIGAASVRDAMDPGGGGGPPKWYCFEWFEDGQGGKKRWGLDYPGWIDFANELRARGQNEGPWACAHKEHAQCIGARVINWAPPYGEWGETHLSGAGYQCIPTGSPTLSIGLSVAVPVALRLGGLPAGIAIGGGALLLSSAFEPGSAPIDIERVEIKQEILHGFAPVAKKSFTIHNPPVSNASNVVPIELPGFDTRHGIPGDLTGAEYGVTKWVDSVPNTGVGSLLKVKVITPGAGAVFDKIGVVSRTLDVGIKEAEDSDPNDCYVQATLPVTETELNGTGWPAIIRPAVVANVQAMPPRNVGSSIIVIGTIYVELFTAEGRLVLAGQAKWMQPERGVVILGFGKERNFRRLPGIRKLGWHYIYAVSLVYQGHTGLESCQKVGTVTNPLLYDVSSDHGINFGTFFTAFPPGAVISEGIR